MGTTADTTSAALVERPVTFLFTDIEGSTRLWERQPDAMRRALARHDDLLHTTIQGHEGRVFKTVGDGFCAAFVRAAGALQAALEIQRALCAEVWDELERLCVRMALHTDVAEERGGDFFGPALSRVARLLAAGHGGQILLSRAAEETLRGALPSGVHLRDFGERRLRDLVLPERIFQIVAPGLEDDFPPLQTLDSRPNNLPAQPTPLVGRDADADNAQNLLLRGDVRLLTLTGTGGTGKTRLALQVAADSLDAFEHGVFYVPLASVREPERIGPAIAQALSVDAEDERAAPAALREHLRERHVLLLLDNLEQVAASVAPLLTDLLAVAPRVKILATSRAVLRVYGEHEFRVTPLALPPEEDLPPVETLARCPAVELFVQRARAVRPDFRLDAGNAAAVAEICARLDGLPLAIELAAAQIKLFSPQAIATRLADDGEEGGEALQTTADAGARPLADAGARPFRHRSLREAIVWSYDLLTPEEKRLFRRLAVFPGGGTLPAVQAVCDADGDLGVAVLDGVVSLLDQSLLRRADGIGGEPRFQMLETTREYAVEFLEADGEAETMGRRHARHFLALAEEAASHLSGTERATWLERITIEETNLAAARRWSRENRDWETALRLAGAQVRLWAGRHNLDETRGWRERAQALTESRTADVLGGGLDAVRARLKGGLFQARVLGNRLAESLPPEAARTVETLRERYTTARTTVERHLGIAPDGDAHDRWRIAETLRSLAAVAQRRGDLRRAVRLLAAAEVQLEALGERWAEDASRASLDRELETARQALGADAFAQTRDEGRAMTWEQAARYALEERDEPRDEPSPEKPTSGL